MKPVMGNENKKISFIGTSSVSTLGNLIFYFLFGRKEYKIKLYILPGITPFIFSQNDPNKFGLNKPSLQKTISRPSDACEENGGNEKYAIFFCFSTYGYFNTTQLSNIHRKLGHPLVDKPLRVIENAEIQDLTTDTRKQVKMIVKTCRACQLKERKTTSISVFDS